MGNYRHGIYTREVPTSLISMTEATAALPVYVGTAPVIWPQTQRKLIKPYCATTTHLQLLNLGILKNGINTHCVKRCIPNSLCLEWRRCFY